MEQTGRTSFRLASDRDYRRGVILGLTLAEVLLLLVFLLLLAAGAIFARAQEETVQQSARIAKLQSQLQPVIDSLNKSGYAISDIDDMAALIRRGQEADALRDQVQEMRSALTAAVQQRKETEINLEQAQRELEMARSEAAKAAASFGKAQEYDKLVEVLQSLPGGAGDHPEQELLNRLGQYRQAMQELARLKGNGSGLPFCWVTPTGQPIYMLRFELHDDGFIVHEEQPRPRPDDQAWVLLSNLPREAVIPGGELSALAAPLRADGDRRKCRYAVDVLDRTGVTNKPGYRHLNYLLDAVFARREING